MCEKNQACPHGGPQPEQVVEKPVQEERIRQMQHDVDGVIPEGVVAADEVIQVEAEEGQLTQPKRIQKMVPALRVRDVRIGQDQLVVKVKTVVERPHKEDQTETDNRGQHEPVRLPRSRLPDPGFRRHILLIPIGHCYIRVTDSESRHRTRLAHRDARRRESPRSTP